MGQYIFIFLVILLSIMNNMMANLLRFGRIKRFHTIISKEIIKPAIQTTPHPKTHNLSLVDRFAPNMYMPIVFFYPNFSNGDTNVLKRSLSECLARYYPLAGRFPTRSAFYIDCNDEGVEFLEATIDSQMDDFLLKNEEDEAMDQLFPNGLGCKFCNTSPNLVEVQLNHFVGGGAAMAVSMSHKVADGSTLASFINQWANFTRCQSPINTSFISSPSNNIKMPEFVLKDVDKANFTRRRFVFPNSKLNELKNKVTAMGKAPPNPTRVEVLTSLYFKCAVGAATMISGSLKPSYLLHTMNIRNKTIEKYPQTTAGNLFANVMVKMADSHEIRLNEVVAMLRKAKMEVERLRDVQEAGETLAKELSMLEGSDQSRAYHSSSLCRFPFYEVNFGWGKPAQVIVRLPLMESDGLIMLDTPSGDGIEALVHMRVEEMAIFEKDKEILGYVEDA